MTPLQSPRLLPMAPPKPPTDPAEQLRGGGVDRAAGNPFIDLLVGKVTEVNTAQQEADHMVHQMLTGGEVNQAEVLTAVQKADMAFRLMLQMRNKLMAAYQELKQIQI